MNEFWTSFTNILDHFTYRLFTVFLTLTVFYFTLQLDTSYSQYVMSYIHTSLFPDKTFFLFLRDFSAVLFLISLWLSCSSFLLEWHGQRELFDSVFHEAKALCSISSVFLYFFLIISGFPMETFLFILVKIFITCCCAVLFHVLLNPLYKNLLVSYADKNSFSSFLGLCLFFCLVSFPYVYSFRLIKLFISILY